MKKRNTTRKLSFALLFALIMLFAMSISVCAAGTGIVIRQESASTNSASISWTCSNQTNLQGYKLLISYDNGKSYQRYTQNEHTDVNSSNLYLTNLAPGKSYYVKITPVYGVYNQTTYQMDYTDGITSAAFEVVTAPAALPSENIKQTAASQKTVTISWNKVAGANSYNVYQNGNFVKTTKKTKVKISKLTIGQTYNFTIKPCRISKDKKFTAENSDYNGVSCVTTPGKPNVTDKYSSYTWRPNTNEYITLNWSRNLDDTSYTTGYRIQVYSLNGKKLLKTYYVKKEYVNYKTFKLKSVVNKGFSFRVQGYVKIGKKNFYGAWSSKKVCIPAAKFSLTQTSRTSLKAVWKKIPNAVSYDIYVSRDTSCLEYKKVATVNGKTTAYTIKNLDCTNTVGVYIVPTVKVNGKKYTSKCISSKAKYLAKYY